MTVAFDPQNQKLKEARSLQTQEQQTQESITKSELSITHKEVSLADLTQQLNTLVEKHDQLQKQVESINGYLEKNRADEKIVTTLAGIDRNRNNIQKKEKGVISNKEETKHWKTHKGCERINVFSEKKINRKPAPPADPGARPTAMDTARRHCPRLVPGPGCAEPGWLEVTQRAIGLSTR